MIFYHHFDNFFLDPERVGDSSSIISGMLLSLTFFKITTGACGIAGIRPGSVLIRILFSAGDGGKLLLIFNAFSGIPAQVWRKSWHVVLNFCTQAPQEFGTVW